MSDDNHILNEFTEKLIKGNKQDCRAIINNEMTKSDNVTDLYEKLVKPALYRVGELWEYNKISVASEHLATSVTEGLMNELFSYTATNTVNPKKIVLSSVEGEDHRVGLKMVSDTFETHGWTTLYLGSDTPYNELEQFIEDTKPNMIGISMSIYFHLTALELTLMRLSSKFLTTPIIIGGQGLKKSGTDIALKYGVTYIADLYQLENFLKYNNDG